MSVPPSRLFWGIIPWYGLLIALGAALAVFLTHRESVRFGFPKDCVLDLALWVLPIGILGARAYYVLFSLPAYRDRPLSVFYLWEGGLAIYGGIIAGILVCWLGCRHKKISFPAMLDLSCFGLLIGQCVGRWGNFMNREAFGRETNVFCRMGLTAPDGTTVYVHPTFLYESLWNLLGLCLLILFMKKGRRRYDGHCILLYFLWYGVGRFWIEGLRTDSLYLGGTGIRVSQLLSLILALAAGTILFLNRNRPAMQSGDPILQTTQTEDEHHGNGL